MNDLKQFIKSYWEYFLELEEQFLETKRFVAFDKINAKSYSIEYLKLYQAICSEIDVVGKEIAIAVSPQFKIDNNTNIKKWGYEIQQKFPNLKDTVAIFNDECLLQPFQDWEYEQHITGDKNGKSRTTFRKKNENAILWWNNYNEIKHRRIGLVEGTKNFQLANQSNLIQALSALFVLESLYIASSASESVEMRSSKLFVLQKT